MSSTDALVIEVAKTSASLADDITRQVKSEPPPRLYHYTSAEGLAGILNSQEIWMTDLRYMNDLSELQYSDELLDNRVGAFREMNQPTDVQVRLLDEIVRDRQFYGQLGSVYSTSFCEDGNLLSQWRAYRGSGGGYAVAFDVLPVLRYLDRPCTVRQLIYDRDRQVQLLDQVLLRFAQLADAFFIHGIDGNDDERAFTALRNNALSSLEDVLSSFKHGQFSEEKEWRLLHFDRSDSQSDDYRHPRVRTYMGNLIPYHPLDLRSAIAAAADDLLGVPFVFREVRIGPTLSADLNRRSIRGALNAIAPTVNHFVSESGIPLRWL